MSDLSVLVPVQALVSQYNQDLRILSAHKPVDLQGGVYLNQFFIRADNLKTASESLKDLYWEFLLRQFPFYQYLSNEFKNSMVGEYFVDYSVEEFSRNSLKEFTHYNIVPLLELIRKDRENIVKAILIDINSIAKSGSLYLNTLFQADNSFTLYKHQFKTKIVELHKQKIKNIIMNIVFAVDYVNNHNFDLNKLILMSNLVPVDSIYKTKTAHITPLITKRVGPNKSVNISVDSNSAQLLNKLLIQAEEEMAEKMLQVQPSENGFWQGTDKTTIEPKLERANKTLNSIISPNSSLSQFAKMTNKQRRSKIKDLA